MMANKKIKPIRPMRAGVLVGIGFVAAVDEIVFHQLLGWHHFYDRPTPMVGLISDGILHAAELICLAAGVMALLNLQRNATLTMQPVIGGYFLEMGGFQLFDGIINHKVLRIHQIRYGVDVLPYDVIWIAVALALLGIGILLARRCHSVKTTNNDF